MLTFGSLELNIHQRILSDIASNIGDTEEDILYSRNLIASKVHTRAGDEDNFEEDGSNGSPEDEESGVFMVC